MLFKTVRLNYDQLPLLYRALSEKLLIRPEKGELLYKTHHNYDCTFFFKENYYDLLKKDMYKVFAENDNERYWINIKDKIDSAKKIFLEDTGGLKIYKINED
jgi:hypothetical protein